MGRMRRSDITLTGDIEHTTGGDPQRRDHRKGHEAQGHEGVDATGDAQTEGLVLGILQSAVHHHQTVVGHDAGDGQRHLAQHLTVLHDGDAATVLHDAVGGGGHILVGGTHHDDVVAVVADGGRNSAVRQPVAPDIAETDVVRVLMPLDDGDFQNILFNIVIPEHVETEIKNGKKVNKTVNMFPGYVLVEMIMTDEAWYIVRNTPGVTGFIGSSGGGAKPFPVNKRELDPILKSMGVQTTAVEIDFGVGDYVEVLAGPFAAKSGKVESIDKDKETATVLVDFLGNLTPIDLELIQLKKIEE